MPLILRKIPQIVASNRFTIVANDARRFSRAVEDLRQAVGFRPYAPRLILVIVVSLLSTGLGLVQPYISKLLIDDALLRRDMHALVWIAGLMFVAAVLGFALNILASYRYVKISAAMLFDMRVAFSGISRRFLPDFMRVFRMGDLMSRLNSDVGEVQRVSADTLLSVLSNVFFFAGMRRHDGVAEPALIPGKCRSVPACLLTFLHFQRKLTALTKILRERSADLGSLFVDTILGMRVVISLRAGEHEARRFRERNDAFVRHHAECADGILHHRGIAGHDSDRGDIGRVSLRRLADHGKTK